MVPVALADSNTNYLFDGTSTNFGAGLDVPMASPGTNDSLQVFNGGSVTVSGNTYVSPGASDADNSIVVTGTNSLGAPSALATAGDFYLGYAGGGNQLIVTNVGVVSDSHGFVGYLTAGTGNNTILVSGLGSVWSNSNYLIFGNNGSGNSLTISAGGQVDALYVQAGFSDNNTALVTGNGSVWSLPTSSFEWGLTGTNNVLTIANGGAVLNSDGYIGYAFSSGNNNKVVVTDPGSVWSNSSLLQVGYANQNTFLVITNGGAVYNTSGTVGQTASGSNSTILVAGAGSLWNNNGSFVLGNNGGGNTLSITDGGRVNAAGSYTVVAYLSPGSGNNNVLVSGAGSVWSNSSYMIFGDTGGNNQMTIANGGRVDVLYYLQGYSDGNTLNVTGPGSELSLPTSSFEVGLGGNNNLATIANGGTVIDSGGYVGAGGGPGTNSTVVVSAAVWTNSSTVNVGYTSGSSQMIITNGGQVFNTAGYVGGAVSTATTAGNNSVLVSDPGSLWYNDGVLNLGYYASQNALIVSNGGQVVSVAAPTAVSAYLGNTIGYSSNNIAVITGSGSSLSNAGWMAIGGSYGGGNQLIISDGGRVDSTAAIVGYPGGSTGNNSVTITGSNSLMNLSGPAGYGYFETVHGANNQLTITNGGRLVDTVGYIGAGTGTADGNQFVTVTGPGSAWSNSSTMFIGYETPSNQMTIADGGRVDGVTAFVGYQFNGGSLYGNSAVITVTGSNSLWNLSDVLYFGYQGSYNQLIISDGGRVATVASPGSVSSWLGYYPYYSSNNLAVVTGAGSQWTNSGAIAIGGSYGNGSTLVITNGGRVDATYVQMGYSGQSQGNSSLIVSGSNSLLNLYNPTYGYVETVYGTNNTITIDNGGRINDTVAYIGDLGSKEVVTVSGAGSIWSNSSTLFLGYSASQGNQLTISGGARVESGQTQIGGYAGVATETSNNVAIVTDPGTIWNGEGILYMGFASANNQLVISNGAQVISQQGVIGYSSPTASVNSVVVTGAGSQWSNTVTSTYGLTVGYYGASNTLTIADGGRVDSAYGFVGYGASGAGGDYGYGNTAVITGSNSLWNIKNYAEIGVYGANNTVIVTNGGRFITGSTSYIGGSTSASNTTVVITGPGSLWQSGGTFYIGTNNGAGTFGINGRATVSDGGALDAPALVSGLNGSGSISNLGGIYQFPLFNPTITPNTAGSIMIDHGTISFRDIANADVFSDVSGTLNQIAFQGNNTFRLNNASNRSDIAQSYTFDTGHGATNYVGLELVNGNTAWRSATLTVGAGGSLLASNTTALVAASLLDAGSLQVVNSHVTYASNVVVSGSYRSDPSTNVFLGDLTVNAGGTLIGGTNDLFDFHRSFAVHETNPSLFDLSQSAVQFSGGGLHTNAITGIDLGNNGTNGYPDGFTANFSYAHLTLGSTNDQVLFLSGDGAASNALYITSLDLAGFANEFSSVSNMITSLLFAPTSINLYYEIAGYSPGNAYLGNQVYQLGNGLGGSGGFLMPAIPEPSACLLWLGAGAVLLGGFRRSRG